MIMLYKYVWCELRFWGGSNHLNSCVKPLSLNVKTKGLASGLTCEYSLLHVCMCFKLRSK